MTGRSSPASPPGAADTATPADPLEMRYAALSDRGLVRERNQDTVHTGPRLLAVADGYAAGGPDDVSCVVADVVAAA